MNNRKVVLWMPLVLLVITTLACQLTSPGATSPNNPPSSSSSVATLSSPPGPIVAAPTLESPSGAIPTVVDLAGGQDVLVNLYKRVSPGIVAIQVISDQGEGLGSGIVIDTEGHVVTNY